ncbi:PAS domain-containing protein [Xanthobacter sp. TB0139]|uniref:PAS domain-containing protein n=1 Tax=Xanthobacter sp. TB0139 TaxID=3459178 RepID=UPI00403943D2
MRLEYFCVAVLGIVLMIVLGMFWNENALLNLELVAIPLGLVCLAGLVLLVGRVFHAGGSVAGWRHFQAPTHAHTHAHAHAHADEAETLAWAQTLLGRLSTPAAILDPRARLHSANRMFLAELGIYGTGEQVRGAPISSFVHPNDHGTLDGLIAMAAGRGLNDAEVALNMVCADGSSLPVHMSFSSLKPGGGVGSGLLQLTVRPAHQDAAADVADEHDFHMLIERLAQVVFQINPEGELLFLNSSWAALLDHPVQESLGKPLVSFIHPEDRPLVEAHINVLARGKRNECHLEARLIARNGTSYWTELRARSVSLVMGERTNIIGTLTDVSQMKRTEASLRANRRSLSMLLANIPGMVYRCKNDRHWSFEFTSDGCVDVTGYEPYEIVGDPNFSYVEIMHPDDRMCAWHSVRQQVMLKREFQIMYRITNRAGNVVWVWEKGKGVFSSTGELLALEGFIADIASEDDHDLVLAFQHILAQRHAAEGAQPQG